MKSFREGKGPPAAADLLICFPSRSHLTLMPKPICSPARPSEVPTRHHRYNNHRRRRSGGAGSHASPILWAKSKAKDNADMSEPTSPKVTCAGQIKVRPKPNTCKNWQSVMEKIEKMHNNKKQKKVPAWIESLGFKKDVMQFLTCLRSIRLDFRCFGSYPTAEITSDDEEEDEEDDQFEDADCGGGNSHRGGKDLSEENENSNSKTVFSKWFMILQENKDQERKRKTMKSLFDEELMEDEIPCVPPSNALLLMRCRSAPAKSWLEEKREEEKSESDEEKEVEKEKEKEKKSDEKENHESLVVMTYGTDFSKFSSDIAKETWVVGGIRDLLSRSRSWKR